MASRARLTHTFTPSFTTLTAATIARSTRKAMTRIDDYRTLGRTGLNVSPLGLGVMTYGWGADKQAARALFDLYRERGGNFFDTADMYSGGESEVWLGEFVHDTRSRDEVVIATKFSFNAQAGNPNAGGNGRKNIYRALKGSLRPLKTEYVDVYILHAWDRVTPVDDVMRTLDDLVRAGKVRHIGFSDVPAWYASRGQTLAEAHRLEPLALLQLEYSLVSRNLEREHQQNTDRNRACLGDGTAAGDERPRRRHTKRTARIEPRHV
jgi:aryl-alcohol dehydrogenase-like predicted oxidoreductase